MGLAVVRGKGVLGVGRNMRKSRGRGNAGNSMSLEPESMSDGGMGGCGSQG